MCAEVLEAEWMAPQFSEILNNSVYIVIYLVLYGARV